MSKESKRVVIVYWREPSGFVSRPILHTVPLDIYALSNNESVWIVPNTQDA